MCLDEWRKLPRVRQLALKSRWDLIFTILNSISFSSVLDVGCGNGAILREIGKRYGCRCYGCDLYESYGGKRAKERVANFMRCDAQQLPFNDGIFDLIISIEVIEHLSNPQSFLGDAYRVLKKEGYLLISTPNWWRFTSIFGRINKKWSYPKVRIPAAGRGHVREYTPKELRKMVNKSNFEIISVNFAPFNPCMPSFSLLDLPGLYATLDRFTNIKLLKPITKAHQYLLARKSF